MELKGYRSVAEGRVPPAYVKSAARHLSVESLAELSTIQLWALHENAAPQRPGGGNPDGLTTPSVLDLKIELAARTLHECSLCERRCGVDRTRGQRGFCGIASGSRYFFEQILWAEEEPLIPSHEVFFCGCNMRCVYCYSWKSLLNTDHGTEATSEEFAKLIDRRRREGATNLNLIGGEPTVNLPAILKVLPLIENPTAIVWNSNFYMSSETMRVLDGVVDLYLGDLRFGNDGCASKLGGVDRYFDTACRNFLMGAESADLIVRHLVIPGHVECCLRPIAKWIADNLPDVPFNLMFQYVPFFKALDDSLLSRPVSDEEKDEAEGIVSQLGLNASRWNKPVGRRRSGGMTGSGEISTTIVIQPDGKVGIVHLHESLIPITQALFGEGDKG